MEPSDSVYTPNLFSSLLRHLVFPEPRTPLVYVFVSLITSTAMHLQVTLQYLLLPGLKEREVPINHLIRIAVRACLSHNPPSFPLQILWSDTGGFGVHRKCPDLQDLHVDALQFSLDLLLVLFLLNTCCRALDLALWIHYAERQHCRRDLLQRHVCHAR